MSLDNTVIQASPATGNPPDPLPKGTLLEGLEIRKVIGVGGFGIVYEAWDPMLHRLVALKEYLPASLALRMPNNEVKVRDERHTSTYNAGLRSFVNEARLLAQFDHLALVKVYRFWEMHGTAYMVMPFYKGLTLKQHVGQNPDTLPEHVLLSWLVALTEALEAMHAQHCYHRDISPENIIVQETTGLPILLDFGAARRAIGNISQPFTVILKASYAPIEQYAEVPSMAQGPWTDVYALAAVAHFLMTGKTPPSSVSRMVSDNYIPLGTQSDLPFNPRIKQAVDRALAVQPHERTASMAQFRGELLQQQDTIAPPMPSNRRLHALPRARTWGLALTVMLVLGLLLGGVVTKSSLLNDSEKASTPTEPAFRKPELQESKPQEFNVSNAADPISPAFRAVLTKAESQLSIHMDNTVLKIGEDLLRFQVESPFSGFVAVYVLSSDQSLIQLLPNVRVPLLPIEAHHKMTLPPANEPIQASGPAGSNQFLVVVTEKPRSHTHLKMQDHYGFGLIQGGNKQLEGMSDCAAVGCQDRLAAAWFSVDEVD